jgi:hypothetical protein
MEQPAMYNLMIAAAAAGINRSTVLRAIKASRISGQRDATGGWEIDPAEFHRVFPALPLPASASAQPDQQQTQKTFDPNSAKHAIAKKAVTPRHTTIRYGALVSGQIGLRHKASITVRGASDRNLCQGVLQTMALHVAQDMSYRS